MYSDLSLIYDGILSPLLSLYIQFIIKRLSFCCDVSVVCRPIPQFIIWPVSLFCKDTFLHTQCHGQDNTCTFLFYCFITFYLLGLFFISLVIITLWHNFCVFAQTYLHDSVRFDLVTIGNLVQRLKGRAQTSMRKAYWASGQCWASTFEIRARVRCDQCISVGCNYNA